VLALDALGDDGAAGVGAEGDQRPRHRRARRVGGDVAAEPAPASSTATRTPASRSCVSRRPSVS
jgi:hypothetical protein